MSKFKVDSLNCSDFSLGMLHLSKDSLSGTVCCHRNKELTRTARKKSLNARKSVCLHLGVCAQS